LKLTIEKRLSAIEKRLDPEPKGLMKVVVLRGDDPEPEDARNSLIIHVIDFRGPAERAKGRPEPEPEPSDAELEAEIARLEAELAAAKVKP
jgi:hypothetical protein